MDTLKILVQTSRPVLYPIIPIIFVWGYVSGGGSVWEIDFTTSLIVLFLTFPLSLIIYGINDIYDYESDVRNIQRSIVGGRVLPLEYHKVVKQALIVTCTIWFLMAFNFDSLITATLWCSLPVAAYLYSVPPCRIKNRPVLDAIFSGFCYVALMFALGFSLVAPLTGLPMEIWLLSILAVALHMYLSIRDYTADMQVGDTTTAVMLGKRPTALLVAFLCLGVTFGWYIVRPLDIVSQMFTLALSGPAFYTAVTGDENFVKRSVYGLVAFLFCVLLIKVIW